MDPCGAPPLRAGSNVVSLGNKLRVVRDDEPAQTAQPAQRQDPALRPRSFDDYIGQAEVIANLRESVRAASRGGWTLDHYLFAGPAGLGKTSLATVTAGELGARLRATSGPSIEHKGALASLLTTLEDGDVVFIDEIHGLDHAIAECLYSAMEDRLIDLPTGKRVIRVLLPRFTLLAATTHAGRLPKPLLDRFGFVWQLRPYTLSETQTIVLRSAAKLGVAIDEEAALTIARAARGTPRIANRLLRRVRDAATNAAADRALGLYGDPGRASHAVTGPLAMSALTKLGIDELGLDQLDRRYLAVVAERPLGIAAIASALSEQRATIEEVVEPFLVQLGFIVRTPRGRVLTDAGLKYRLALRA